MTSAFLLMITPGFGLPARAAEAVSASDSGIKNVLVIVLDALRADHLGCYGYRRNTSPAIDRLARQGIVFDRAIVQAGWTKPSVTSYFTSSCPGIHKVLLTEDMFPANATTMADVFSRNGYFTYGFVNNSYLDPSLGFGKGFHVYRKMEDKKILSNLWLALTGRDVEVSLFNHDKLIEFSRFLQTNEDCNRVINGGWERSREGWPGETAWRESGVAHSGQYAMHVDKRSWPGPNFYHLNQKTTLKHGGDYLFGAFVKTKDLQEDVSIELYEPDDRGDHYVSTNKLSGTNDWTLLLGSYRPWSGNADNQTEVRIRAGRVTDFQAGEFWVDDVFILPLDELPSFRPSEKLFFYVHFLAPHAPYDPPPEYLNLYHGKDGISMIDKYDGEIRAMDTQLGILFEGLESLGILDQTLVVITSDHGEAFGEHGDWTHGAKHFYEEVARVPLIFYCPKLFPNPSRHGEPVESSVDLLPSLIDLLALKVPKGSVLQEHSYFGENRSRPRFAFLYETPYKDVPWDNNAYVKTVTDGEWKYITNEYRNQAGDTELRGVYRGDEGTEVTVVSPREVETAVYPTIEELQNSDFFKSLAEDTRTKIASVYLAADKKKAMLFNLKEDPGEKKNVIDLYPEKDLYFQRLILERYAADREFSGKTNVVSGGKAQITDSMREQLRALGYMN
ncbi:MAG: sulfatase [PVC group bacterium]